MTIRPNPEPPVVVPETSTTVYDVTPAVQTEQFVQSGAGIEQQERSFSDATGAVHRQWFVRDVEGEHWIWLNKLSQLIWLIFGVIEVLIGLRILLKLIGANPYNDFAHFIYNASAVFLAPFFGLVGSPAANGMVLELPSLIAMLVYAFLGWAVVRVIWLAFYRPLTRSASTYDRYRS